MKKQSALVLCMVCLILFNSLAMAENMLPDYVLGDALSYQAHDAIFTEAGELLLVGTGGSYSEDVQSGARAILLDPNTGTRLWDYLPEPLPGEHTTYLSGEFVNAIELDEGFALLCCIEFNLTTVYFLDKNGNETGKINTKPGTYQLNMTKVGNGILLHGTFETGAPYVAMLAQDGALLWEYDGQAKNTEQPLRYSNIVDANGTIYLAGGHPDGLSLLALTYDGNVLWEKVFGDDSFLNRYTSCGLIAKDDGLYLLARSSLDVENEIEWICTLVRFSYDGEIVATLPLEADHTIYASSLTALPEGFVIVGGSGMPLINQFKELRRAYAITVNEAMDSISMHYLPYGDSTEISKVLTDTSGNAWLVGYSGYAGAALGRYDPYHPILSTTLHQVAPAALPLVSSAPEMEKDLPFYHYETDRDRFPEDEQRLNLPILDGVFGFFRAWESRDYDAMTSFVTTPPEPGDATENFLYESNPLFQGTLSQFHVIHLLALPDNAYACTVNARIENRYDDGTEWRQMELTFEMQQIDGQWLVNLDSFDEDIQHAGLY